MNRESEGKSSGIPYLAKNERDTRISCTRHPATPTCAAFIEESRMKFINASKLHRKSGGMGHPSLCEGTRAYQAEFIASLQGSQVGYSVRSASMGSIYAALRAGIRAAIDPTAKSVTAT